MTASSRGHQRPPIKPERVRRIDGQGFAFVPNRFLRDGFFVTLTALERSLYFFLVLAGDRNGVSFYHYDSICSTLEIPIHTYLDARNALIAKDLIATDGTRIQVLSLPEKPIAHVAPALESADDMLRSDRATIRATLLEALHPDDEA